MNNTLTNGTDLKGCFWNPKVEQFTCVIFDYSLKPLISKCKDNCPKVCSENYWKCNDLCIPVSQSCDGKCMPYYTYKCKDICIPTNKPCNGNCNFENQINCKGFCLEQGKDEAWILKFGCEGKPFCMK